MSLGKYDGTENALTKALTLKKDFDDAKKELDNLKTLMKK